MSGYSKDISFEPGVLRVSYNKERTRKLLGFFAFMLLAVGHVPLIYFGDDKATADAIGLFDLYVVVLFAAILYKNTKFYVTESTKSFMKLYSVYLFYVSVSLFLFLPSFENLPFSAALWLKQFQYLVIGIISFYYIKRLKREDILHALYLSILFLSIYGFYRFFFGNWYRLGIPFTKKGSPNPAGFMLGIQLLMMLYFITDKSMSKSMRKLVFWVIFLLGYTALLLTVSRTNNLAFFIVLLFFMFVRFRNKIFLVLFIISFLVLAVYIGSTFIFEGTAFGGVKGNFFSYIINPQSALEDSSFTVRYTDLWVRPYNMWDQNLFTNLFGIGIGRASTVDNLFLAVLYNFGIVGFFIYFSLYLYLFFIGDYRLKIMLVFILINGIAAETALNSFRSMQVVIFYLIYGFIYFKRDNLDFFMKRRERWTASRKL
jgi:hypothetical protein